MLYVRVKIHFLNVSMKNENECRNFLIVNTDFQLHVVVDINLCNQNQIMLYSVVGHLQRQRQLC
jgi:hypothetical protein